MELLVFIAILIISFIQTRNSKEEYRPTHQPSSKDTYLDYIASNEWKVRADASKTKDDHTCQRCGGEEFLQTHHITYKRLYHEHHSDLTTLCSDCHKYVHLIAGKNAGYYPVVK